MKKVAIYARFSDDELQNDNSIEDQIRTCKARAEAEGWQIVQVYTDHGISGASMLLRPGIQMLMSHAQLAQFDLVLTEGLDRLSRDQEDIAGIYKRIKFAGLEIYSLSDGGLISEMHIGLKGTMNAVFLKDLAVKTRRGLSGRIEKGKSGGGISYGYKVVKKFDADGMQVRGDREIIEAEAEIVQRIFKEYVSGISPKKIAFQLNKEQIPCPSGKSWGASTIYGNRKRGTGILNNELYIGKLVWNRLTYVKNPDTGKRVSRLNPQDEWQIVDVPHLRIVGQDLWNKVKERQVALDKKHSFQAKQRPKNLFSFLLKCGCCGNGLSIVSSKRYGCSTARNKGTCINRLTIKQEELENTVLKGLQENLMQAEVVEAFCEEYTRYINELRRAKTSQIDKYKKELVKLEKDKANIIEAIKAGIPAGELKESLDMIVQKREKIEHFLSQKEDAKVLLHPAMSKQYKKEIASLRAALNREDSKAEASTIIRSLIDKIVLTPKPSGKEYAIDLHGDLAGILSMATGRYQKLTASNEMVSQVARMSFSPGLNNNDNNDWDTNLEELFLADSISKDKVVAGVRCQLFLAATLMLLKAMLNKGFQKIHRISQLRENPMNTYLMLSV
jgi:DNA invertase Pin-like site-specific DNA recombinase